MAQSKARARKSNFSWPIMLGLLLVGGVAAIGTILIVGDVKLPFFNREVQAKPKVADDRAGKIAVPLSARDVGAYAQVALEDLFDVDAQRVKATYVDPKAAEEKGFLTNVNDVVGRVMARDKKPGYAFKESDFLPKGTRPGPTAGLELGTRGMWVGVDHIEGLRGLERGDRFDVMAVKYAKSSARSSDRSIDPALERLQREQGMWDASNRVLVQNGKIVMPVDAKGAKSKAEVFIQVADSEVDPLTDALAVGAQLRAYSRSSQPGADATPLPTPEAPAPIESIEVIKGGESSIHVVPKSADAHAGDIDDADPLAPSGESSTSESEPLLHEQ